MKTRDALFLQWLITLIPVVYYLSLWNQLPEEVPTHYNFRMEADDFHSKTFLLVVLLFMGLTTVFSSWSMNKNANSHQQDSAANPLMVNLSWIITFIITMLMIFIVLMTKNYCDGSSIVSIEKIIFSIISIFFALLGYKMKNAKPNLYFGIRTKWTFANELVWRETHLHCSKVWSLTFALLGIVVWVIPEPIIVFLFLASVIFTTAYSYYFSYKTYQVLQKDKND